MDIRIVSGMAPRVGGYILLALSCCIVTMAMAAEDSSTQRAYFSVRVVDEVGDGVPCVTLRTVHDVTYTTDVDGYVAFYEPGLMATGVWFHVSGPHISVEPGAFDYKGQELAVTEGGSAEIEVTKTAEAPCDANDLESRRLARGVPDPDGFFRVEVIDAETGRGVPLVEITGGGRQWVSDSNGLIAIDPLGFEDRSFEVELSSHGYSFEET